MRSILRIYRYLLFRMHAMKPFAGRNRPDLPHDFVEKALRTDPGFDVPDSIHKVRKILLANAMRVPVHLFGASKAYGTTLRQVGKIVKRTSVPAKQGAVLYRLSAHFHPELILELGTGVGLGTLYLTLGYPGAKAITVEGNRMLADIATSIFADHGLAGIQVMQCTFDEALQHLVTMSLSNALIFVDGDHTYEGTLQYFSHLMSKTGKHCVMVFHDIHWSEGMEEAWKEMRSDKRIMASYDLYDMGILCNFGEEDKKDFVLRY